MLKPRLLYARCRLAKRVECEPLERTLCNTNAMTAAATRCVAQPDPTTGEMRAMNASPTVAVSSTSAGVHSNVPARAQVAKTAPGNSTSP